MNSVRKHPKLFKYKILRNFPGRLGTEYQRKYLGISAQEEFDKAVNQLDEKVCIDLGANIGKYTRLLASRAGLVIAFEPDPWLCVQLEENVSDLANVQIENVAVGTAAQEVLLYRHKKFAQDPIHRSESNSTLFMGNYLDRKNTVKVRQIDFVNYLENLRRSIGIIKIDIEGAEVELLEALFDRPDLLERIDYIFAETHERFLKELGPRVARLRERAKLIQRPRINLDWH